MSIQMLLSRPLAYACLIYFILINNVAATFYQSDTMALYCKEYIKYLNIEKTVKGYEAGVCSGFVASTIELMNLSERLCKRDKLNMDSVVQQFIQEVDTNEAAKNNSATYVLVDVLQQHYACE